MSCGCRVLKLVGLEAGGGRGPTIDSRGSEDIDDEGVGDGEAFLRDLRGEPVEPVF